MPDRETPLDQTVPGGHYLGADGTPHDAHGQPLGKTSRAQAAETDDAVDESDEAPASRSAARKRSR